MVNILSYLPGGGGNHLKNIISLDGRFDDQWPWDWVKEQSIGIKVYDQVRDGTAHSLPGRNLRQVFVEHITQNFHSRDYLVHGHFGELALYKDEIKSWPDKKFLLLSVNNKHSIQLIKQRQIRLGQNIHPYWIEEEQIFLYQPDMYNSYFACDPGNICSIELCDFWQKDLVSTGIIPRINDFFNLEIDQDRAQAIHEIWIDLNFKGNK